MAEDQATQCRQQLTAQAEWSTVALASNAMLLSAAEAMQLEERIFCDVMKLGTRLVGMILIRSVDAEHARVLETLGCQGRSSTCLNWPPNCTMSAGLGSPARFS